jgi:hypothetical protein
MAYDVCGEMIAYRNEAINITTRKGYRGVQTLPPRGHAICECAKGPNDVVIPELDFLHNLDRYLLVRHSC